MNYTTGSHTVFHHRYHIVWITKYRYKVLEGELRDRIRTIIRQVCKELGVQIVSGVLSKEHVHMFVEIPRISLSATSYGGSKDGRLTACRWSFRPCVNVTGDGISGLGVTSAPPVAILLTMSYFSICESMNLPASAGSYSVSS